MTMPKNRYEFEAMLLSAFYRGVIEGYGITITDDKSEEEKRVLEDFAEAKCFKYDHADLIDYLCSAHASN